MTQESKGIDIGGLWINESKAGKKYMSGPFSGGSTICVFKNENKKSEKAPDYRLTIFPYTKKEDNEKVASPEEAPF